MSRRESVFHTSLLPAAKMMAAGAVVTAVGIPIAYAGFSGGEGLLIVLGVCAAISGPIMLLAPFFTKRGGYGDCPVCASKIEAFSGDQKNLLCGGCGAYLDVDGERLVSIERERMAEKPFFAAPTPWPDIRNVISSTIAFSASDFVSDAIQDAIAKNAGTRVMEARWPQACAVCGGQPVRRDQYALEIKMAGNVRDTRAKLVVPGIPYCGEHKDGIDFAAVGFDSKGHERVFAMRFRSHAYREAFRAANPWRWEGMVAETPAVATQAAPERVIVRCPNCAQQLRVQAGRSGRITCPACAEQFTAAT
jgi:Zn finger protein HypA/HybF involved in hydrogenase expression